MTGLPPWRARNAREREAMITWSCEQLDKRDASANGVAQDYSVGQLKALRDWVASDGPALDAARHGNIGPLRKQNPHIAEFLFPPKLARGKKFPKRKPINFALAAAWGVKQLRDNIWPEHFRKKNRRRDDGPSAEDIVARWLGESVGAIKRCAKPSGQHKSPRRKSRVK